MNIKTKLNQNLKVDEIPDFDKAIGAKALSYKSPILYLEDLKKIGIKYSLRYFSKKGKFQLKLFKEDEEIMILYLPENKVFRKYKMVRRRDVINPLKERGYVL